MDNGVVDFLRERAEENLDDVLKSSMGGYTKKSVQDYVAQLRRQQQAASKRFDEEMKNVLSEKESLKEELNRVKTKFGKREAQYRALSDSLQEYRQSDESENIKNIAILKRDNAKQANTISSLETEKQLLEQKQGQLEQYIGELKAELVQMEQENRLSNDMLQIEKRKAAQNLKEIQELSTQLTIAQNELAFMKEQTGEGSVNSLKEKISKLQEDLRTQQGLLKDRAEELEVKEKQIQSDIEEKALQEKQMMMLETKLEQLQKTIDLVSEQNQQLEAYQNELVEKLQEVFQSNIAMLHEKSELRLQNQKLQKQLEDVNREKPEV